MVSGPLRMQPAWRLGSARVQRLARIAALAVAGLGAGGCELLPPLMEPPQTDSAAQPPSEGLQLYLETMEGLGSNDPARQADVFYAAEQEYTRAPTTTNTLRYAAALVTPGHPSESPTEGKRLLESLLATPERMVPAERTLVAVLLIETNARLKLEAENRRLLETLDENSKAQANSDKRVQAQVEENARLRRALAEAQQKLEAIKEIERSIIERSSSPPGNRETSASETQSSIIGR